MNINTTAIITAIKSNFLADSFILSSVMLTNLKKTLKIPTYLPD